MIKTKQTPDIIEEIIPGKNNDYKDKSIYQTSNNGQQSLSNNYVLEQTTQSVKKALEDPKRIMEKSRGSCSCHFGLRLSYPILYYG
jgi:hypothetical protein